MEKDEIEGKPSTSLKVWGYWFDLQNLVEGGGGAVSCHN
jgi:hypothetical protein